jgi:hypothetical protein
MTHCSVCGKPTSSAPYQDHYLYFHLELTEVSGRDKRSWYFCSADCLIEKVRSTYRVSSQNQYEGKGPKGGVGSIPIRRPT